MRLFYLAGTALLVPLLSGCSVAREELRPTYDPAMVILGASKDQIDNQLGTPQVSAPNEIGEIVAVYETTRVYKGAPRSLASQKLAADVLTLGLAEIPNGFGLADSERGKTFRIKYSSGEKAEEIELTCHRTWGEPPNFPDPYTIKWPGASVRAICGDVPKID